MAAHPPTSSSHAASGSLTSLFIRLLILVLYCDHLSAPVYAVLAHDHDVPVADSQGHKLEQVPLNPPTVVAFLLLGRPARSVDT